MKTVIEMAREAGLLEPDDTEQDIVECGVEVWLFGERGMKALERFAELARADEREACAYRAGIALLGADRGLANRVDQAIRSWRNT